MLVFRLSQVNPLVTNARKLLKLSRAVVGDTITDAVLAVSQAADRAPPGSVRPRTGGHSL